jgi:hypothetical protein
MRDVPYIEISMKKEPRRVFRVVMGLTTFDYPGLSEGTGGWELVGWLVSLRIGRQKARAAAKSKCGEPQWGGVQAKPQKRLSASEKDGSFGKGRKKN